MSSEKSIWSLSSYKNYIIKHQPIWPNIDEYNMCINQLNKLPSLVYAEEIRSLKSEIENIVSGDSFILQIGDCSENFDDCEGPKIHNFIKIISQMSSIIENSTSKKVIKIGRIAGQYAKPRSEEFELINGEIIPTYKGDNINSYEPNKESRTPNPQRLIQGYYKSAAILNLIRAFTQGGYLEIDNFSNWKSHFYSKELDRIQDFKNVEKKVENFVKSNQNITSISNNYSKIYTSHEGLLLDYEAAFTRTDTVKGGIFNTSAHTLWIGERTRGLNEAHVEYFSGIENPIGIKVGPKFNPEEIVSVLKKVNPGNHRNKIILIGRFGSRNVECELQKLINTINSENLNVIWMCDPMHGNTFQNGNFKTRSFDDICSEFKLFVEVCKKNNQIIGGIHLELTGEYVSECIGGVTGLSYDDIKNNYKSKVDPRLNAAQAIELSFKISEFLN
jgi:3-deoxy-7-phosphoheptulonate synthase